VHSLSEKLVFIESIFGKGILARNGKNFAVRCPICAPTNKEKKKLVVRTDDDANHCWTCGWAARSLAPLIKRFGTFSSLVKYRDNFAPHTLIDTQSLVSEQEKLKLPDDFRILEESVLFDPDFRRIMKYVKSRGLDQHDIWRYRIGVSNEQKFSHRVIVPSFDENGTLNYYVARAIDDYVRPRYNNAEIKKTNIIFNEINVDWSAPVVLCEGVFDMFKCGDNVIPLLGSDLNEQHAIFNAIIMHGTPVVIALDPDMLHTKVPRMTKKLVQYDIDVQIVDVTPYKDPGSMSKSEFNIARNNAKHYSWDMMLKNKIALASSSSYVF
jgi:DNA primase